MSCPALLAALALAAAPAPAAPAAAKPRLAVLDFASNGVDSKVTATFVEVLAA